MRSEIRVLFAHGLESSPQGNKARLFAQHFSARTPAMNTRDFESCVQVHAEAVQEFAPNVVIGSSFGGAVVVELLTRGLYRGATLLLAQAAIHYNPLARLPPGVPVTLVHGHKDDLIPIEHSRELARTGSPELITVIERDDDHPLSQLCDSGDLIRIVEEVYTRARTGPGSHP